jgi:large subunit ribosomal protein L18
MNKKKKRLRRAMRCRLKLRELNKVRLCIHRTPRHIYAQVISSNNSTILVAASTIENGISGSITHTGNKIAAEMVGKVIAERCIAKSINHVSFDRSGFKFHGRIKALASSARKNGLVF